MRYFKKNKQTKKRAISKNHYQQTEGITQISQGVTVYVCICVCAVCFLSNLLSTWWVYCRGFNREYCCLRSFEWMVLILRYKLFIFSAFTTSDNLQVRRVRRIFSKPPPHVNFQSVWVMAHHNFTMFQTWFLTFKGKHVTNFNLGFGLIFY